MKFGITDNTIKQIQNIFAKYEQIEQVILAQEPKESIIRVLTLTLL
jgi:hypothetical protein